MARYASIPTYDQSLSEDGITSKVWYFFFQNLFTGNPPASESAVIPSASPFSYTAARKGFMIVNGGTVGVIKFSRSGGVQHITGVTQGAFPLSAGDALLITYSATPTLTFVPQ